MNNIERHIKTTYQVVTQESAKHGDYADAGFEDEEGFSCEPEIEEETAVDLAVEFLTDNGVFEPSDTQGNVGTWYSSEPQIEDISTDEEKQYSFHLYGFSEAEEKEIFNQLKSRGVI